MPANGSEFIQDWSKLACNTPQGLSGLHGWLDAWYRRRLGLIGLEYGLLCGGGCRTSVVSNLQKRVDSVLGGSIHGCAQKLGHERLQFTASFFRVYFGEQAAFAWNTCT
jgi:hypothetical protein